MTPMNTSGPRSGGIRPVIVTCRNEEAGWKVLTPGWDILSAGGNVLDAVEQAVNVSELDPDEHTVGYSGWTNSGGWVQLDASCMYGPTHQAGAVAALEGVKKACSVARRVMERTRHVMLVGADAQRFAIEQGFPIEDLLTKAAREKWEEWKSRPEEETAAERPHGTINVLAVDRQGDIAGITSTSGLAHKLPGRVGDSPILGAGLYVDNEIGAAGAIGHGEEVMRTCGSFYVVSRMRDGLSPAEACLEGCRLIVETNRRHGREAAGNVQFTALNKNGDAGCASIRPGKSMPKLAYINPNGFTAATGPCLL